MKKYKVVIFMIIIFTIVGLFKVNLNLNRQIYTSIVQEQSNVYSKLKTSYNLDDMVDVLSYPHKYDVEGISENKNNITIPKIRVLFNKNPFDFRIDFKNYTFSVNRRSIQRIENNIFKIPRRIKSYIKF